MRRITFECLSPYHCILNSFGIVITLSQGRKDGSVLRLLVPIKEPDDLQSIDTLTLYQYGRRADHV